MRRHLIPAAALAALVAIVLPSSAPAAVPHVVQPGESLWTIAAQNNFTTRSLAAFNGLSESSPVVVGSTVRIPSVAEASGAMASAPQQPAATGAQTAAQPASTAPAAATGGGYRVRAGETLSGIAARNGLSTQRLASYNGLGVDHLVVEGTSLRIPSGSAAAPATTTLASNPASTSSSSTSSDTAASDSAPTSTPNAPATPESNSTPTVSGPRVDASTVQSIAAANGVPSSLATAIAWQESGFNNDKVSSANARGVMQVMPGTWDFIQRNLSGRQLNPNVASDNIHAGTLYLKRLLGEMGGNPDLAVASYYQGPGSVKRIGMLPETQRYVNNVRALRGRFGG